MTFQLKAAGNMLKEMWKLHRVLTNRNEISSWCYAWVEPAGQANPGSSLQQTSWLFAMLRQWVFEEQNAHCALCGINILQPPTFLHQTKGRSLLCLGKHLKKKLSLLPRLHLNPLATQPPPKAGNLLRALFQRWQPLRGASNLQKRSLKNPRACDILTNRKRNRQTLSSEKCFQQIYFPCKQKTNNALILVRYLSSHK